jgi:hypothetical protein
MSKPQNMGLMADNGTRFSILSSSLIISSVMDLPTESLFELFFNKNYTICQLYVPICVPIFRNIPVRPC